MESPEQEEKLPLGDVTLFMGVAARANYLGPDRSDKLDASKGSLPRNELTIGEWAEEDNEDWQILCWKTPGGMGIPKPGASGGD